jgi:hypothetical protein
LGIILGSRCDKCIQKYTKDDSNCGIPSLCVIPTLCGISGNTRSPEYFNNTKEWDYVCEEEPAKKVKFHNKVKLRVEIREPAINEDDVSSKNEDDVVVKFSETNEDTKISDGGLPPSKKKNRFYCFEWVFYWLSFLI